MGCRGGAVTKIVEKTEFSVGGKRKEEFQKAK